MIKYPKHLFLLRILTLIILLIFAVSSMKVLSVKAALKPESSSAVLSYDKNSKALETFYKRFLGNTNFGSYDKFLNVIEELKKEHENYNKDSFPYEKMLASTLSGEKRVDEGKEFIQDVVKHNNRLDYYDLYIKLAKAKGYIVTSYIDYLTKYKNTDQKVLILRHDIDVSSDVTKLMFEIEKKEHVKATYYFRWSSFDKELIKEIASQGFEVGLHYETIATYCIDNNKYIINTEDIIKCREILKNEIKKFKEETGVNIETIASHGNPVNKQIKMPNYILLIGQNYKDFGIVGETYDENIIKEYVKSYICDGELTKNFGFSYSTNPIDSILKNDKVIEFLSHPNHWSYNIYQRALLYMEFQ